MARAPGYPQLNIRQTLEEWISGEQFSCLGARASVRRGALVHGEFGALGDPNGTEELHSSMDRFIGNVMSDSEDFATFVAVFDSPVETSDAQFESLLWRQLDLLHRLDRERYDWADGYSRDPASPQFAFSVAASAFFVVGMHAQASRMSRRFPLPAIAFNPHEQFRRLKEHGVYQGLQRRIRQREMRLQHCLNPNLAEHGTESEAKQYAGRPVDPPWSCPFDASSSATPHIPTIEEDT